MSGTSSSVNKFPSQESEQRQAELETIRRAWGSERLSLFEPIIIPRGKEGINGVDVWYTNYYDQKTGTAIFRNNEGQEKRLNWNEIHDLNNPVKTARDWYILYYRTTGNNRFRNPDLIDNRLMTVMEFNSNISPDIQDNENWNVASQIYNRNHYRAIHSQEYTKHYPKIQTTVNYREYDNSTLTRELLDRIYEPISPYEIPYSGDLDSDDFRIHMANPLTGTVYQERTYATNYHDLAQLYPPELPYRIYLQVNSFDIEKCMGILNQIGISEAQSGSIMKFEAAIGHIDQVNSGKPVEIGNLSGLRRFDPTIAVYFPSKADRDRVLRTLTTEYEVEMSRMSQESGLVEPLPLTRNFVSPRTNKQYRVININDEPEFTTRTNTQETIYLEERKRRPKAS